MDDKSLSGKRILLLFPHMVFPGGALHYMLKLSELLMKNGAVVGILTLRADNRIFGSAAGAEILSIGGPLTNSVGYWLFFPLWQKKLEDQVRDWRPDILVPQVFPANWWAWLYRKKHPAIHTVWICPEPSAFVHSHDWINALRPFWKKYLARLLRPLLASIDIRLSRYAEKIVVNSRYTASMVERIYHRQADAVAYPGIDLDRFQPCDIAMKQDAFITVAKLTKFKRVDFLLRVFSLLLQRHKQFIYHIVGQGEEEEFLRKLAGQLGIADKVIFHGSLDNRQLAVLLGKAKLFLHGSVAEPFGMAPLEAIACNTPVIAHRSGGPVEFVNDSCGLLLDTLSEKKWCRAIDDFLVRLKTDQDYFSNVAAQARKFSWDMTLAPALQLIAGAASGR
jgi:glycosyltransferase involved in cell wall biosynthesis